MYAKIFFIYKRTCFRYKTSQVMDTCRVKKSDMTMDKRLKKCICRYFFKALQFHLHLLKVVSCYSSPKLPYIPNMKEVESIFPKELCDGMNWASEKSTFNLFMQLVDFPAYRPRVLLGVTYAAGGISANLVC